MTRVEHLLVHLGEEASEITKDVSKALRFGPEEVYEHIGMSNAERIVNEINDLWAIVELLQHEDLFPVQILNRDRIRAKKEKVEKYLEYSKSLGRLTNDSSSTVCI